MRARAVRGDLVAEVLGAIDLAEDLRAVDLAADLRAVDLDATLRAAAVDLDAMLAGDRAERPVSRAPRRRGLEQRCARIARQSARIVLELRRDGHQEAAAKLEAAAIEAVELVRRGAL
jgi:hypothetical protein